jgi:hypothetical protein
MNSDQDKHDVTTPAWLLPTPPRTDELSRQAIAVGDVDLRQMT